MRLQETPVLSVQHLTVRYGEGCPHCLAGGKLEKNRCPKCGTVYAANDISLDVYPGEVLGIVGESGSGKSTLMQSLYFDLEPRPARRSCRTSTRERRASGTPPPPKSATSRTR